MDKPKQLIIIGGGFSVKEGIDKGLWSKLKDKFTIGINYNYNFFNPTLLSMVDKPFYEEQSKIEDFKKIDLIVSKQHKDLKYLSNTIKIKSHVKYHRDIQLGCYSSNLAGLFSLSLGIYLLDEGEIFILGYDYKGFIINNKLYTHWYQDTPTQSGELIKHRGIQKTNYYEGIIKNKNREDIDFGPYKNEVKCKIYNVSLDSCINIFPKISYDDFFKKLNNNCFNQNELRENIRRRLKWTNSH